MAKLKQNDVVSEIFLGYDIQNIYSKGELELKRFDYYCEILYSGVTLLTIKGENYYFSKVYSFSPTSIPIISFRYDFDDSFLLEKINKSIFLNCKATRGVSKSWS